jgi:hypothetical protein
MEKKQIIIIVVCVVAGLLLLNSIAKAIKANYDKTEMINMVGDTTLEKFKNFSMGSVGSALYAIIILILLMGGILLFGVNKPEKLSSVSFRFI